MQIFVCKAFLERDNFVGAACLYAYFAFTVLNPIDEFLQKKQKIVNSYDIDFDEALHFNMGNFVYEYQQQHYGENSLTDDIYEKIIETEGVGLVFKVVRKR